MTAAAVMKIVKGLPLQEQAKLKDMMYASNECKESLQDFLTDKRFADGRVCPHCGGTHVRKNGHYKNGHQKYICVGCGRSFTIGTDTIYSGTRKDISVWQKYMECMAEGKSLDACAEACGIVHGTSFAWRHKILDALSLKADDTTLQGDVEADETFNPVSYKGNTKHFEDNPGESPRKRGGDVHTRGLSDEMVCVPCAVDTQGNSVSKVAKLGKCSKKALHKVFDGRIGGSSTLCSDGDRSYVGFAKECGLKLVQVVGGKGSNSGCNIQRINSYHSQLKKFLSVFNGVSTKYLNNYLIWNNAIRYCRVYVKNKVSLLLEATASASISIRSIDIKNREEIPVLV